MLSRGTSLESNNNRLNKVKEEIRKRLKELNNQENLLNEEAKNAHKDLTKLRRFMKEIEEGVSQTRLREIVKELSIIVRVGFPFTPLARFLVVKHLKNQIEEIEYKIEEISEKLKILEKEKKTANICPECKGLGSHTEIRYVREDGFVTSETIHKECTLCQGKGRIEL